MGREVGEGFRMGTHVHPWLIHVNVWQKPLQCCNQPPIKKKKICSLHQLEYWGMGRCLKGSCFLFPKGCSCFWNRVSSGNVDLKKNKQLKSCEFKLYSGTLEKTIAGRQLLSSSEEIAPKKQRRSQFIYDFWLCMQSSIHLGKRLLLVTNNRYLRLMILLLF